MAASGTNRHWEEEMLAEYLARFHARDRTIQRVRLGPAVATERDTSLSDAEQALLGAAFRRWADAVIVTATVVYVVEAAMIPDPGDISRVETYLELFAVSPELVAWKDRPRQGLLLWAVDDLYARTVAVRHGLHVAIFRPSNWTQYMSVKRARETRAPNGSQLLIL